MRLTLSLCKYLGKGPRRADSLRPRRSTIVFNNRWHLGRELKVTDPGFKDACLEKGIPVYKPEDVFSSYLPSKEPVVFDFEKTRTIKGPFANEEEHPHYHERPAHMFSEKTKFPKNLELNHAKVLLKTVEIETGLPQRLTKQFSTLKVEDQDDLACKAIKETQMFDATQVKLPYNYVVPYIGWNSVNDKMTSRVPYEVTMSWQWKTRQDYGIPIKRKNMNMIRSLLAICDQSSDSQMSLLYRLHLENNLLRQFIEKDGRLVRFFLPLAYIVTDTKPLEPFCDPAVTKDVTLPDISPMNPFVCLWEKNIYNDEQNFPLKESIKKVGDHFVHTCIDLYNNHIPGMRTIGSYHANTMTLGFVAALGQARHIYGPKISGVLPKPVTVNVVSTDGRQFHFGVYQLNTLDLSGVDGVKNVFWHQPELEELYEFCGYEKAVPTLKGYNPEVFDKLMTMYLQ